MINPELKHTIDAMTALAKETNALTATGMTAWQLDGVLYCLKNNWHSLSQNASVLAADIMLDAEAVKLVKEYTERTLTLEFMSSPMPMRAYCKPQGYAGDYRIMEYYYDAAYEGESHGAQLLHRLFVDHPLSRGVVERCRHVVARILADTSATREVLSLGCGPSREIKFLNRTGLEARFTLVDQDEDALETSLLLAERCNMQARLAKRSFGQIIKNPALLCDLGRHDLAYSTGLFDYLNDSVAVNILRTMGNDLVRKGGEVLIANAAGPNYHFFEPEFVLDWTLIYRTKDDMNRLAVEAFGPDVSHEIYLESSGAYWFLRIQR